MVVVDLRQEVFVEPMRSKSRLGGNVFGDNGLYLVAFVPDGFRCIMLQMLSM